jgi:hypothetical protein
MAKQSEDLVQRVMGKSKVSNKGLGLEPAASRDSLFADLKKAAQKGREERGDPRPEREHRITPISRP